MSVLVVMGVCGSGKSTVGQALAQELGCCYAEGDLWHPPSNREKMSRGVPLTDEDRLPWLHALHDVIVGWLGSGEGVRGVMACSALKRSYRDILTGRSTPAPSHPHTLTDHRGGGEDVEGRVVFVLLTGPRDELERRLATREGHFMPAALLQSQLETLEPPSCDERVVSCDVTWSLERTLHHVTTHKLLRVDA